MKSLKRVAAGILAVVMTFSFAGCSGGDKDSSSKREDKVKVISTDDIKPIADGEDKTLLFMGLYNLNPTNNDDKTVGLTLFEEKGGKVEFARVTSSSQYSKLGAAVTAGKDVPDLFGDAGPMFPCQVVQGFFQPVDDIVDFTSPLWEGVKDTADQYVLNGKHYVAPISFAPTAMLFYDKDVITEIGMDDPQDLYYADEWDYDAMDDLMSKYVSSAKGDEERYGINGWYAPQYIQQTGETLIQTDDYITYKSNLDSAKIAAAEERLANWKKNNWVEPNWIGQAAEAFKKNVLFYSMGTWAASGSGNGPQSADNWGVVPFPKDPSYEGDKPITSARMCAYSWVAGSTKTDAVRAFYECYRIAETDETYKANGKAKWKESNLNWTDDDYAIMTEVADPDTHLMIFDPGYGVSSLMGDDFSGFMVGVCLVNWLYKSTSVVDEEGKSYTWTQTKEKFGSTVDGELKTLNESIQKFIANDK